MVCMYNFSPYFKLPLRYCIEGASPAMIILLNFIQVLPVVSALMNRGGYFEISHYFKQGEREKRETESTSVCIAFKNSIAVVVVTDATRNTVAALFFTFIGAY